METKLTKVTADLDKVLDNVDDQIGKMYQTIESKLKHVSKSFDAKFDQYDMVMQASRHKIEQIVADFEITKAE